MRKSWTACRNGPGSATTFIGHDIERAPATEHTHETTTDVTRAMARLRPRDREILWLAYAEGASHREIAERLGVQSTSMKLLLFRARRKLADILQRQGVTR